VVSDLERRLVELRFLDGVEKVEHVPYPTGDQLWVRFNKPLDLHKLEEVARKHNCATVTFANVPSRLPKRLAEVLWDGVTHVITKKISRWSKFKASLGFEPEGIAKVAIDLYGPYQIFITTGEEGVQVLYEYLGLKHVPSSPPTPAAPKPVVPVTARPTPGKPQETKLVPQPVAAASPAKTADSTQTREEEGTSQAIS
jgi:hypothetical protein